MPEEQRIITAGFVTMALVVLGVLAYFLIPGEDVDDALGEIQGNYFPAYLEAEERGQYADQQTAAEQILEMVKKGGRATIMTNLEALATDNDRTVQRLYRMLKSGEFERVAAGEFPFEKGFYPAKVHRGLTGMQQMVRGDVATLRRARDLAMKVKKAIEEARVGSGHPLPAPPPSSDVMKSVELESNPILEADARLFAYLTINPELLIAALKTKNPGGKANSARLIWNRDMAQSGLTAEIKALPPQVAALSDVAGQFAAYAEAVEAHPQGPKAAAKIYEDAMDAIAKGLDKETYTRFSQNRKQYESGTIIRELLQAEVQLLRAGEDSMPALADALQQKFQ